MESISDPSYATDSIETGTIDADNPIVEELFNEIDKYENNVPTLLSLAYNDLQLSNIAKHMHTIFQQPGTVRLTQKMKAKFENAIRIFTYESGRLALEQNNPTILPGTTKESTEGPKHKYTDNQFTFLTKQLLHFQQEASKLHEKDQNWNDIEKSYKDKISKLLEKNENLFSENNKLTQTLNLERRERANEGISTRQQYQNYTTEIQILQDKCSQLEFVISRLQNQMSLNDTENTRLTEEIANLKTKNAGKSERNRNLAIENNELKLQIHELESNNEHLQLIIEDLTNRVSELDQSISIMNQESFEAIQSDCSKLQKTVKSLVKIVETQSNEITNNQSFHKRAAELISREMELINQYDLTMAKLAKERDEAVQNYEILSRKNNSTEEKLRSANEQLSDFHGPLFEEIHTIINNTVGDIDSDNVVPTIREYFEGKNGIKLIEQNNRLFNIIENQLRFIQNLAHTGEIEAIMISKDTTQDGYYNSEYINNIIEMEIARCRTFIQMNDLVVPECDIPNSAVKTRMQSFDNFDSMQREAYDLVALQSANAEIIRAHSERNAEFIIKISDYLKEAAQILNYENDISDFGPYLVEKIREVRRFFKAANNVSQNIEYEKFDSALQKVSENYKLYAVIAHHMDTEIREAINDEGPITEIHHNVLKFIKDMKNYFEEQIEKDHAELREQMKSFKHQLEEEMEIATKANSELEVKINHLENDLSEETEKSNRLEKEKMVLQNSLDIEKSKRNEAETKFAILEETSNDYLKEIDRLKYSAEVDKKFAEQRSKQYEERIERIIQEDRMAHEEDKQALESKYNDIIKQLEAKVSEKHDKAVEARKALKEVIRSYDEAFQKQKEVTKAIRNKNAELTRRLQDPNNHPNRENVDQLTTRIRSLEAEKQILEVKLSQANDVSDKVAKDRDTYWTSQIAVRETEFNRLNEEKMEIVKKAHEEFVNRIAIALELFVPSDFVSEDESVLNLVSEIAERLCEAEKSVESLKALNNKRSNSSLSIQSEDSIRKQQEGMSRAVRAIQGLQEWERWAKTVYENANGVEAPSDSRDLRFKLSEMVLAAIQSKRVVYRLESLHDQKAALLAGAGMYPESEEKGMKAMAVAAMFANLLLRKVSKKPLSVGLAGNLSIGKWL